jgi:hypothetical protein
MLPDAGRKDASGGRVSIQKGFRCLLALLFHMRVLSVRTECCSRGELCTERDSASGVVDFEMTA